MVVRRTGINVELQVDDHQALKGSIPSGFSLQPATFYIGGVPGNFKKPILLHSY